MTHTPQMGDALYREAVALLDLHEDDPVDPDFRLGELATRWLNEIAGDEAEAGDFVEEALRRYYEARHLERTA